MDLHFLSLYAQGEWTRDPIDAWYASGGWWGCWPTSIPFILIIHGWFYKYFWYTVYFTNWHRLPKHYTVLYSSLIFYCPLPIESMKANAMKISRRTNSDFDACNNSYVLVWHHQIPKSQNKKICHIQQIRYASIRSRAKFF